MRVSRQSRAEVAVQNLLFLALFLGAVGLAAWLSTQHVYQADLTYGRRNSLSDASVKLLGTLKEAPLFTAYVRTDSPLKDPLKRFFANYQRVRRDIRLEFVDIDADPQAARAAGISADGEVVLSYAGRSENLTQISEAEIGNALQRLARSSERYVVYLTGDGERDLNGQHNFDLGSFGKQLTDKGFKLEPLNLAANPVIPENTEVLVIAGPQAKLLPGMVAIVRAYIRKGGNLLWLNDPGPLYGLDTLAQDLGVRFGNGTIVDAETQLFGISDPKVLLVPKYPAASPITRGFTTVTLFPAATSVETDAKSGWKAEPFLQTLPRSWLETGPLMGAVNYDAKRGDKLGPLDIGVSLTRELKDKREQRVVVTGDGDFLSNAYLGNVGNLDLGLDMLNWLAEDDSYIDINPRPAPDLSLSLTPLQQGVIGVGFLFALPLMLALMGIGVWLRRRRR
ncbi:MAG: GldG family protein [Bacillota bacterium]